MQGYIYAIGKSQNGPIKIGFSASPKRRLSQLQTSHYEPLILIAEVHTNINGRLVESALHTLLSPHAMHGEWFDISMDQERFVSLVTNIEKTITVNSLPEEPEPFISNDILEEAQFTYTYGYDNIDIEIFIEDDNTSDALRDAKKHVERLLPYL